MNNTVNIEMLVLGRELRALTQKQLSLMSNIDQGLISRYEGGIRSITENDLATLARTLDLPKAFFYRNGRCFGLENSSLYHRKRQNVPSIRLKKLHAVINKVRLDVERLLEGIEIDSPYHFVEEEVTEHNRVEDIAAFVRSCWRLPSGPVRSVTAAIENAGGIIVLLDFEGINVDAIVQWIKPNPPVFLVNKNVPGDRMRYSLAHEIGHLVMHQRVLDGKTDVEEEANRFAAEFLMPAEEIASELEPVNLPHLAQIKPYWKVSIQALIRRSRDLGAISERQYRSLFELLSSKGYRTSEPISIPIEKPTLLKKMIQIYRNELGYSLSELSQLLTVSELELHQTYLDDDMDTDIRIIRKYIP